MKTLINIAVCLLLLTVSVKAQEAVLFQKVSFNYQSITLEEALTDISKNYDINFAYSPDVVPIYELISAFVVEQPLSIALDELFITTDIVYATIGDQIALKVDENKVGTSLTKSGLPKSDRERLVIVNPATSSQEELAVLTTMEPALVDSIGLEIERKINLAVEKMETTVEKAKSELPQIPKRRGGYSIEGPKLRHLFMDSLINIGLANNRSVAQFTVVPKVSTRHHKSTNITNNLSLNVLWGKNGGVDGVEFAGLVNVLQKRMRGVQIAGLGNLVKGDAMGTQLAGFFNKNHGRTIGFQMAGVCNYSQDAVGFQLAGFSNRVAADHVGLQIALLRNQVKGIGKSSQLSALINTTNGVAQLQIGGLYNKANTLSILQIGLINKVNTNRGLQIGLINRVAEKEKGLSIGLLNFIKDGYNRVEIGYDDTQLATMSIKFGSTAFYNIIHSTYRWKGETIISDSALEGYFWGIGYGIGTSAKLSNRIRLNIEALGTHINENEQFTQTLNTITQGKATLEWRLGKRFSLFGGMSYNYMFSKLYNEETQVYGSSIRTLDLIKEETIKGINHKAWWGINAGIRF